MVELLKLLASNILYLGIFLLIYIPLVMVLQSFADALKEKYQHHYHYQVVKEDKAAEKEENNNNNSNV